MFWCARPRSRNSPSRARSDVTNASHASLGALLNSHGDLFQVATGMFSKEQTLMGKTLILGATGNISGTTADIIHRTSPDSLRVATSRERKFDRLKDRFPDAEPVLANWNDLDSLVAAMEGVSKLMVVTPDFRTDEHVVTPNIIKAAEQVGSIELIARILAIPPGYDISKESQAYIDTRCGAAQHAIAKPQLDASGLPVAYVNIPAWIMHMISEFFAPSVKESRQIAMPGSTDAERMWVSELDISEIFARILMDPADEHVGREYVLTSTERHSYGDVAREVSKALGEKVEYVDDAEPLRNIMGGGFDTLMTYLDGDGARYADVVPNNTISQLLGRPEETVSDYVVRHLESFR